MKLWSFILVLIGFIWMLSARGIFAEANFTISQTTTYAFDETGNAEVKKSIQLTNLTTNIYPSIYYLDLPDDASSVAAADDTGKLNSSVTQETGVKQVKIPIEKDVIGFNQSVSFVVTYKTRSLAQKRDNFWTITIPTFTSNEQIERYDVSVTLPDRWGTPLRVSPDSEQYLSWNHDQLKDQSIVISYEPDPTITSIQNEYRDIPVIGIGALSGISFILISYLFVWIINRRKQK